MKCAMIGTSEFFDLKNHVLAHLITANSFRVYSKHYLYCFIISDRKKYKLIGVKGIPGTYQRYCVRDWSMSSMTDVDKKERFKLFADIFGEQSLSRSEEFKIMKYYHEQINALLTLPSNCSDFLLV